jgi:hypothetical protein
VLAATTCAGAIAAAKRPSPMRPQTTASGYAIRVTPMMQIETKAA